MTDTNAHPVFPAHSPPLLPGPADPCGHMPGDRHDSKCDYWRGVAAGEYAAPGASLDGLLQSIRRPLVQPAPLTDPALQNGPTR